MSKTKNIKKSLIFSVLSMLSCASMFVGATYAWFTDNVTINNNHIVAGNLDIELLAKKDGEYKTVNEETSIFDKNALWEPGHVEVINLKVANVGSLALEYSLGVNIVHEDPGISVKTNEVFHLSEYINYAIIEGEESYANRDEAILAAERVTPNKLSDVYYETDYDLLPKNEEHPEYISEHYITMIVYMPKDVGNEANHKTGTPAPTIQLGVNLSARQLSFESDSFDNKYDYFKAQINNKFYFSLKDAVKDAKDGETIKLLKDVTETSIAYTPSTPSKITLDLRGYTLTTTSTSYIGNYKTGTALDLQ